MPLCDPNATVPAESCDALRRELRICRHEADRGGNHVLRDRIGDDARFVAQRELAGHIPGQEDRQVGASEVRNRTETALPFVSDCALLATHTEIAHR
jgi:hypothetical protein